MTAFKETFNNYKNRNEEIPLKDLKAAVTALGFDLKDGELEDIVELQEDTGRNGMDFITFLTTLGSLFHTSDEDEIKEAFRVFDKDGNGKISRHELRHVMKNLGEKLSDEEIDEMITEADVDGDGEISYQEFLEMLRV